jgi:hypothetical protein
LAQFIEADHQEASELDVDLLEEERNKALAKVKKYKESLKCHCNKRVVPITLEVGNLVLKKDARTTDKHKFSSPWEGPQIEIVALGAYVLADIDGKLLKNTWNVDQLRMYYV